jgi:hypothetical protein
VITYEYMSERATWAVTEGRPDAGWKLFRQRYWSNDALAWAQATLPLLEDLADELQLAIPNFLT